MDAPWTALDDVWCFATLLVRCRYSLLTIILPAVLAGLAIASPNPGTLYSLLILRGFRGGVIDVHRFFTDLFVVAAISFAVVGLGCVGVRLVESHGDERMASSLELPRIQATEDGLLAWHPGVLAVWIAGGTVFPTVCWVIGRREANVKPAAGMARFDTLHATAYIVGGALTVGAIALVIGSLRATIFGRADWILPFRPPAIVDGHVLGDAWLAAAGAFAQAIGFTHGYLGTDGEQSTLLPSQFDLVAVVGVSLAVYVLCTVRSLRRSSPVVNTSTAAYLLLALGAIGVVAGGVAFWGDRYGLSPLAIGLGWVFVIYRIFKTDHYYELLSAHVSPEGHHSRGGEATALTLPECLEARASRLPVDAEGRKTIVVVAAAGGGIQASAWTAKILTRLADSHAGFTDAICVISGVSGGAVGAAYFLAGRYLSAGGTPIDSRTDSDKICRQAFKSLLEPVGWGLAFADLVRSATGGFPRNPLVDRGWALEQAIDDRLKELIHPDAASDSSRSPTLRDLRPPLRAGTIPLPLFNATSVDSGQRVIFSPVDWKAGRRDGKDQCSALHLPHANSAKGVLADVRIATAVRLSATFSYATPVARPHRRGSPRAVLAKSGDGKSDPREGYLCDGGYSDNSGVIAALDACRGLLNGAQRQAWRVIVIRLEPFPDDHAAKPSNSRAFWRMLVGPATGLLSARVATQRERAEREINDFAAKMGEHVEVLSTTYRFPNQLPDCIPPSFRPPLSWTLSGLQQLAIETAGDSLASAECALERHPHAGRVEGVSLATFFPCANRD